MTLPLLHQAVKPQPNYFVISGCSGSGKSTLLEALRRRGEAVVTEPGRRVVKEQAGLGSGALPWEDAQRFAEHCTAKAIKDFKSHLRTDSPVFFDRSLVGIASAVEAFNLKMFDSLADALSSVRYAPSVFMSAPWEALFRTDEERRHHFQDAVAEYEALVPAYQAYGYEVVFLPKASVEERVAFIASTLDLSLGPTP